MGAYLFPIILSLPGHQLSDGNQSFALRWLCTPMLLSPNPTYHTDEGNVTSIPLSLNHFYHESTHLKNTQIGKIYYLFSFQCLSNSSGNLSSIFAKISKQVLFGMIYQQQNVKALLAAQQSIQQEGLGRLM